MIGEEPHDDDGASAFPAFRVCGVHDMVADSDKWPLVQNLVI